MRHILEAVAFVFAVVGIAAACVLIAAV